MICMNQFNTAMGYMYLGSNNTVLFHGSQEVRKVLENLYCENDQLQNAFRQDTSDMIR